MIVDSQVHVWRAESPDRPWVADGRAYAQRGGGPLLPEQLISEMDAAGVDRALLVGPTWEGARNELVLEAAARYPDRFRAVVRFPIDQPAADSLCAAAADRRVAAVRACFVRGNKDWLAEGRAEWLWPVAEELDLPVMLYAPWDPVSVRRVIAEHPRMRVALCHLNLNVHLSDDELKAPLAEVLSLAQFPNVSVKASSLPSLVTGDYPFWRMFPIVEQTVDAYGSRRVFWGSDLSRLRCSYRELVTVFSNEMTFLDETSLRNIMGAALCDWVNWP